MCEMQKKNKSQILYRWKIFATSLNVFYKKNDVIYKKIVIRRFSQSNLSELTFADICSSRAINTFN